MDKHLVAFDANGTLLDDRDQFFEALNAVFIHFGCDPLPPDEIRERFSQPWTDIYSKAGIYPQHGQEELYRLYNDAYRAATPPPQAANGCAEALEALRAQGCLLAVISAQQDEITRPLLETLGLLTHFNDVVSGVEDKAEALRALLKRYNLAPAQSAYVGDQDSDMRFARRVGVLAIGYAGGIHSPARLLNAGAQVLIDRLDEIPGLFVAEG
jgi:phosphoglycolate phosphatase